jgi:hypothetical protein
MRRQDIERHIAGGTAVELDAMLTAIPDREYHFQNNPYRNKIVTYFNFYTSAFILEPSAFLL